MGVAAVVVAVVVVIIIVAVVQLVDYFRHILRIYIASYGLNSSFKF